MQKTDLEVLREHPLFSRVGPALIHELLSEAPIQRVSRGAVLFEQGTPADRFYVVLRGCVKLIRRSPHGDDSVVAVLTRGESFAEAAIFDRGDYPVTAEVVFDAHLFVVVAEPFLRRLRHDFDLSLRLMAAMSRHLRRLVHEIEQLKSKSAAQRLADFLSDLVGDHRGGPIRLPYDKSLIAARLGMQPETLSRAFRKLQAAGVRVGRGEITIPSAAALADLKEGGGN